jgi:hypothetical protein
MTERPSVQCFRTRFEEDPSARSVLPDAATLHGVRSLALGLSGDSGCALATEGTAQCWGRDVFGRTTCHEYRPAARFWVVAL